MVFVNNYKWFFHAPISFCHVNQLLKITASDYINRTNKKKPELISSGKTQNTIIHPTRSHEDNSHSQTSRIQAPRRSWDS